MVVWDVFGRPILVVGTVTRASCGIDGGEVAGCELGGVGCDIAVMPSGFSATRAVGRRRGMGTLGWGTCEAAK